MDDLTKELKDNFTPETLKSTLDLIENSVINYKGNSAEEIRDGYLLLKILKRSTEV